MSPTVTLGLSTETEPTDGGLGSPEFVSAYTGIATVRASVNASMTAMATFFIQGSFR